MGERLLKYYEKAKKEGGVLFQVRLAMKTGITSVKAETVPDSHENIQKFEKAYREISS